MKTTRLSLLLLLVALSMMMLGRTQQSATSASSAVAWPYEGLRPQPYTEISAAAIPGPTTLVKALPADKSLLQRVYLSLQLVKHPELDKRQMRIILNAISMSSPEFFVASNEAIGKVEEDILKMYFDIAALPLRKRRASFRNASAKNKSELWRTQLALFLARHPESNERQKDVILSAMSLATPAYFELRSSDPAWNEKVLEPSRSLEEQIMTAFTLADAAKLFATLGDGEESASNSRAVLLKHINYQPLSDSGPYKQWAHSRFAGQDFALEQSACQCSTASDYCPAWGYCRDGNCTPTESGCGTLWSYPCNGASCR